MKKLFLFASLILACVSVLSAQTKQPNVILIVCDDLNTDLAGFGGHEQAKTSELTKLMESGMSFKSAHCTIPICAPSRSSFLTGIYPHQSANFGFGKWQDNELLYNSKTIMGHFKESGYNVIGTGKLMHHQEGREWSHFENQADYGPYALESGEKVPHPQVPQPMRSDFGWVDGSFGPLIEIEDKDLGDGKSYKWGTGNWKGNRDLNFDEDGKRIDPTADELNGQWAVKELTKLAENPGDKPFFMGVGFLRPHTPLIVDQRFFDMFPLDEIELPPILEGDAEDTFQTKVRGGNDRGVKMYNSLLACYPTREEALKRWVQAYLACVVSVDELIGSMLAVVDNSSLKENTIIIVTSDHGWGNGQKDYLYKNALWEESTRVPLIVRAPGVTTGGTETDHPVSLIDLFPTLIDLCGLSEDTRRSDKGGSLDGFSLTPFLKNPSTTDWEGPDAALTATHKWNDHNPANQNYALRTKEWRYIRYHTGDEELYNKDEDPYEWKNLAGNPEYETLIREFRDKLKARVGVRLKGM